MRRRGGDLSGPEIRLSDSEKTIRFSRDIFLYNRVLYCYSLTESTQSWCYLKRKTIGTFRQSLKVEQVSVSETVAFWFFVQPRLPTPDGIHKSWGP